MTPSEFAELRAFALVAEERNFRRAAKRLGLSPSALSRAVRSLEERLGVRLLNRTTRSVAPTEAGQGLYARIEPTLAEMDAALRETGAYQSQPKGVVRINLPSIAAKLVVMPRLGAFAAAFPGVELDLVIDNEITDIVARGFDAGVRIGGEVNRDMIAVRLTPDILTTVVGSPDYFAAHPPPKTPRDLSRHRCLSYRFAGSGALLPWRFEGAGRASETIAVENAFTTNDTDLLLAGALQGMGLAFLPEDFVAPHLKRGELLRVLADYGEELPGFYLYYSNRTRMPAVLRVFIDFIKLGTDPGWGVTGRD
ncbi:LysR family transcriptional regulator [Afifella marina]|uniref:DNA-binding transcriptional regulator, LysR family n=1 Tax=Afifella marina DSM 2698 TaxID=1120955 RepID=A0A1G5MM46_AFIMA|nr:LysR family transcriptional regulator [Afifella marina]MBK1623864.1 LysR family transcriptional regulator [Afifella marina DSM 2698]MBK1627220.1 LysR family transcriptional regulator [Afifella marina]MBK5918751.1 LysR family transcriptional regulator [Afifella marina]RAI22640.1 LysR family transcriptional regulator [Afifella marina DSM 2698]SCZ25731.1 DNA-binding transcriptional regulator, LysR family [Afifella marina DSM 2698]